MRIEAERSLQRRERSDQEFEKAVLEDIPRVAREQGLDFFPTEFYVVPAHTIYEVGAYGLPGRFSHWTFGRDYYREKTMYDHGITRIYETVINTNPARAFLLENNNHLANMVVAAHVLGHVDFFKNNTSFKNTDRKMDESSSVRAERIRTYEFEHGKEEVEKVLDAALALEWNIDTDPRSFDRPSPEEYRKQNQQQFEEEQKMQKRKGTEYDDILLLGEEKDEKVIESRMAPIPYKDDSDILWQIAAHSPKLEEWQREILYAVRKDTQYFVPQRNTKIMNEGWASFMHVRIFRQMNEEGLLSDQEYIDFAKMHAGVVAHAKNYVNPYLLGMKVFEDIEQRFKGEYNPDNKEKTWYGENIDPSRYKGRDEYDVFRVREQTPTDQIFLQNFLSEEVTREVIYPVFAFDDKENPQEVKRWYISQFDNFGMPVVKVARGGVHYKGGRELYLKHIADERELDVENWGKKTLQHVYFLWGRPVHLETKTKEGTLILTCSNGKEVQMKKA